MSGSKRRTLSSNVCRVALALCCAWVAVLLCSCAAASNAPGAGRPRADQPAYPITLDASEERRQKALAAWTIIVGEQVAATAPTPELRPVTSTITSLPSSAIPPPRMPKVTTGETTGPSEEETRESLRRFIKIAAPLLGLEERVPTTFGRSEREPTIGDVALVEYVDGPAGTRVARYSQNPFDLPLRNGFGVVQIGFTPDLRVTALSSTAIPDAERLNRLIEGVRQNLSQSKVADSIRNRSFSFRDASGTEQTRTVSSIEEVTVRDLVVFPRLPAEGATKLELRLAWEISIGSQASPAVIYVDAVTGEQLSS
jgi:hypothetical protein